MGQLRERVIGGSAQREDHRWVLRERIIGGSAHGEDNRWVISGRGS